MDSTHTHYSAAITVTDNGIWMGMVLEVPGAASFANSEEELIDRLRDAAASILEYNKSTYSSRITPGLSASHRQVRQIVVPCA